MIKHLLLLLFLLLGYDSYGQDSIPTVSQHWQLGLGYQNFRTLDINVSPLIYSSNNGSLNARYQKSKENNFWNVGMNIALGSNQSVRHGKREAVVYDPHPISGERDSVLYEINPGLSFIQAELFYSKLWKIKNKVKPTFVGALVSERFSFGAMGADVWFFNQLSLMAAGQSTLYNREKSKMDMALSIPIASYLLRQPYTLDPSLPEDSYFKAYLKTGSQIAAINKFQQVNVNIEYTYQLHRKKALGVSWQFMWMNNSNIVDRNLNAYANSFSIIYRL